jgi:hypothetical protein
MKVFYALPFDEELLAFCDWAIEITRITLSKCFNDITGTMI